MGTRAVSWATATPWLHRCPLSLPPPSDKFAVARRLRELSALLFLRKGASFHARAYRKGADALEALSEAMFASLLSEGRLPEVPGIGPSIARQITELSVTGRSAMLTDLRDEFPAAIVELAGLPSLSLVKARTLRETLDVQSIDDLERACLDERVRTVTGFGAKTERKILDAIAHYRAHAHRILLVDARALADRLVEHLDASKRATRVVVAGDVRRWVETTDEIRVVVESADAEGLLDDFAAFPLLARIERRSAACAVGRLSNGVRVRVDVATVEHFAFALVEHTGSEAHVSVLRHWAAARAVDLEGATFASEADVYARVGCVDVPPELREGNGELLEAARRPLPFALIEMADIRGMVHCHTTYSDGRDTIEAMALRADALGMEYLTITDHSPTAHYAGGVTRDRLKQQWEEIALVQERVRVRLLRGTESDILGDGNLDYPDDVLEQFDVIIASVHSRMKMDEAEMTRRLVRAMALPMFKIWGHPLGRLLQRRKPFGCDVEAILDVIARSNAAIEINGDPHRLDMEPRWIRAARSRGLPFVVSTDAHSTLGMDSLVYGVAMARRGGLVKGDVLNTRSATEFRLAVRPWRDDRAMPARGLV